MKSSKLLFLGLASLFVMALVILIPLKADTDKEVKKSNRLVKAADDETIKLIKTIRVWKLVTEVSLSEKQLVSVLPLFGDQEKLKSKFRYEQHRLIKKLKAMDKNDKVSNAQLKKAVDEYDKLNDEFDQAMNRLDDKLMSKMTPKQQVKYILFEDSYSRELRQTLITIRELGKEEKRSVPSSSQSRKR